MTGATITISAATQATLTELATRTGESPQIVLAKAVEAYRRQQFLEDANRAYDALQSEPEAWAEEQAERQLWETTLLDGLEND